MSEYQDPEHASGYLEAADGIPHRREGEAALLEEVPTTARRCLDLGCGDGRLLALVLRHAAGATGVAVDFSATMLEAAHERFAGDDRVEILKHDLSRPLPELGRFDVVVSSFAIHHVEDARKRELYEEIWRLLEPDGVFCNLEHVASPTENVHRRFLDAMAMGPEDEDPSNRLLDVETQLEWLREIGFADVDCVWKWRELALLCGRRV